MMDAMPLLSETSNATEALVSKAALTLFMARPIPAHSAGVGIWRAKSRKLVVKNTTKNPAER